MIFAKLDVDMWGHEKFVAAGPAAVGYWAAALAYLRQHTSSDGYLAPHVLGLLLGLGEREARKLCERLVASGLFGRQDRGYVLLRYAAKNETREQIEARRSETRARVAAHRNSRRNGVTSDHGNADCNASCNTVQAGAVPGSGSHSGSGSDPGEPERVIRPDDALTPELRELAKMLSVQDVDGAWLKFCGNYAGQVQHVQGMWQKWCVGEAKRERTERDRRNNPRYSPPGAPESANPYETPSVLRERARREREREESQKNAVPMPAAELFAAIGGRKT